MLSASLRRGTRCFTTRGNGDSEAAQVVEVDPERVEHVQLELVNVPQDGARFAWAHHSSHRPGYWAGRAKKST
jgi:hypothetical protein